MKCAHCKCKIGMKEYKNKDNDIIYYCDNCNSFYFPMCKDKDYFFHQKTNNGFLFSKQIRLATFKMQEYAKAIKKELNIKDVDSESFYFFDRCQKFINLYAKEYKKISSNRRNTIMATDKQKNLIKELSKKLFIYCNYDELTLNEGRDWIDNYIKLNKGDEKVLFNDNYIGNILKPICFEVCGNSNFFSLMDIHAKEMIYESFLFGHNNDIKTEKGITNAKKIIKILNEKLKESNKIDLIIKEEK